jgi:hypothetical protein
MIVSLENKYRYLLRKIIFFKNCIFKKKNTPTCKWLSTQLSQNINIHNIYLLPPFKILEAPCTVIWTYRIPACIRFTQMISLVTYYCLILTEIESWNTGHKNSLEATRVQLILLKFTNNAFYNEGYILR